MLQSTMISGGARKIVSRGMTVAQNGEPMAFNGTHLQPRGWHGIDGDGVS